MDIWNISMYSIHCRVGANMTLSDKIEEVKDRKGFEYSVFTLEDVKEFIKQFKRLCSCEECTHLIDELAGDKLI